MNKVEQFLRNEKVPYTKTHHPEAFTAQEVAATAHVSGRKMVKVVIVRADDGKFAMAVTPAMYNIDLELMSHQMGAGVRLATEAEMAQIFDDVEVGAEPPFGNVYGVETITEKCLAENQEIAFQAGTHTDIIRMSYADWERLVKPTLIEIAQHEAASKRR